VIFIDESKSVFSHLLPHPIPTPRGRTHIGGLPRFGSLRKYAKQVYCKFIPPYKKQRMPYLP